MNNIYWIKLDYLCLVESIWVVLLFIKMDVCGLSVFGWTDLKWWILKGIGPSFIEEIYKNVSGNYKIPLVRYCAIDIQLGQLVILQIY